MSEPSLPLTGGCMCGGVRFELSEPPVSAMFCHCTRCRRRTGVGFSIGARAVPGSFRIVAGEELVRAWDPGDGGWAKSFCSRCGSQLFSSDPVQPDRVSVRMGGFDEDPGVRPSAHQFVAYAPAWSPVPDDGLPQYPERVPDAG
jgi:hypothetical protein